MKANNQIVPIKPEILIWARRRLNLEISEVSNKLKQKPTTISNWENGKALPSLSQLEKLAYDVYKIPLATFFLPEVPDEPKISKQFRTIPEKEINRLPSALLMKVKEAQYYQTVLEELYNNVNPIESAIFKTLRISNESNLEVTADIIRKTLGISLKSQASFKNTTEAFKFYRNAIESNGVFVFQQTLKNICRGYSLFHEEFPIIVINSSEISDTGKCFTLFHELGHLLHSTGGISNEYTAQSTHTIEVFCNKLASLVLVNNQELLSELNSLDLETKEIRDEHLEKIARRFRVSQEVILRKLLDLGLATHSHYEKKRSEWLSSLPVRKKSSGGNHFNIKVSQLSHSYTSAILSNMYTGSLSRYQAATLLKTKINHLSTIEKLVFK